MEKFPANKPSSGESDKMGVRPSYIVKARIEGDTRFLKAAGRQGGLATAEKRRREKDIEALYADRKAEQAAIDEHLRQQQAGEDIIPPSLDE
jgi:hypothetical protein